MFWLLSLAANPPGLLDLVSSQRVAPGLAEQACRVCNSTPPRSEASLDLACSLERRVAILNKKQQPFPSPKPVKMWHQVFASSRMSTDQGVFTPLLSLSEYSE
jgi:hypothetical protein